MQLFYDIIDIVLPFEWIHYDFMKNAFLTVLLITPIFGILGTMVVNNRMSFFSDALGHGAFTGIAIGSLFGMFEPVYGAVIFSVLFSVFITVIKNKSRSSTDTIIGVFSSIAISLGLVILTKGGSFNKYSSFLVGDLLTIKPSEILLLLFVFILVIVLWVLILNKLLLISINSTLAKSRKVRTQATEMIFTCSIAVIITISIQWVGILIINSLLVLPAAAARNISSNIRKYTLFSVIISLASGICGLILSYYINSAPGATIVLISGVIFFITLGFKSKID